MNRSTVKTFAAVLSVLVVLCLLSVAAGTPTSIEPGNLPSRVERLRGLAEVWGMVHYFHPALADPQKQAAWEAELLLAIAKVEAAEAMEEYALVIQGMIAKLGDGGTSILMPDEIDDSGNVTTITAPIKLLQLEGRTFIAWVDEGAPGAEMLSVGMELISVNGVEVTEWLERWLPVASGQTSSLCQQWVFDRMLSGVEGDKLSLLVRNEVGDSVEAELTFPSRIPFLSNAPSLETEPVGEGRFLRVQISSLLRPVATYGDLFAQNDVADDFSTMLMQSDHEGLILDLRMGQEGGAYAWGQEALLLKILGGFEGAKDANTAGYAQRMHHGLTCTRYNWLSNSYSEHWTVRPGVPLAATNVPLWQKPVAILLDRRSYPLVAEYIAPIQASDNAVIVGERGIAPIRESFHCLLPGGYGFQLRISIPWFEGEAARLPLYEEHPTVEDLQSHEDVALQTAITILSDWENRSLLELERPSEIGEMLLMPGWTAALNREHEARLLGLFKLWNAIRYFYPFPEMIEGDWVDILEEFIPRIEAAGNRTAYYHELQHMLARTNDGHAILNAGYPAPYKPPIEVLPIEGKPVIVSINRDADTGSDLSGLGVGMVITEIDGRPVQELIEERLQWLPASTDHHRLHRACGQLLTGTRNSSATVAAVDSLHGEERLEFSLVRDTVSSPVELLPEWLASNVVLVRPFQMDRDLFMERIDHLRSAEGLILDMRKSGHPDSVSVPMLIDFLSDDEPWIADQQYTPVVSTPDLAKGGWSSATHYRAPGSLDPYSGSVVILTNAFPVSSGETMLFYLQGQSNINIVGEPTAGTTGGVTFVEVIDSVVASFTGMKVLHGDGSPFQGIGIIPDVEVHPTIQGIREGRDEILEKGLEVLQEMIEQRKAEG
jgi:C-terminal processing protease CtpA/Prc